MPAKYPAELVDFSVGQAPVDGQPILAVHFNRIAQEITAMEAALGIGNAPLIGPAASLAARLGGTAGVGGMNDNGTLKQEVICEDDPSGNERPCARFWCSQQRNVVINPKNLTTSPPDAHFPFPVTAYDDDPPAFFACIARTDAAGFSNNYAIFNISAITQVGAVLDVRNQNGGSPTASVTERIGGVAISRNLRIFDDARKWVVPPGRSGP